MNNYTKLAFYLVDAAKEGANEMASEDAARSKKAAAESGAPQNGKKGTDWGWGVGGTLGLATAPSAALNKLYASDLMAPLTRPDHSREQFELGQKLRQMATDQGVHIVEDFGMPMPTSYHPNFPGIGKPVVFINNKHNSPGAVAHELGHHQGSKGLLKLRMNPLGGLGIFGGLGGAMFTRNEDTARRNALIGSGVSAVGYLPSEIDASVKGYKLVKSLGGKTGPALKAFVGLPTYAAGAALPLIGYGIKKFMGGYDKAKAPVNLTVIPKQ